MHLSGHYLSPDYLFNTPSYSPGVAFGILTGLFGALFLVSLLAYWRRGKLFPDNSILRRLVRRASKAGMWVAMLGLFFALMRYTQFPYLSMPIFIYLVILLGIVIVGYFAYDLSERYPIAMWNLERSHLERRYRAGQKRRLEPEPIRPKARGKRRR